MKSSNNTFLSSIVRDCGIDFEGVDKVKLIYYAVYRFRQGQYTESRFRGGKIKNRPEKSGVCKWARIRLI